MTQNHIETLNKARKQLVDQRRSAVEVLAAGYERGATERNVEEIVKLQAAIKAIDAALR
jgi:hypothetical protein